MYSKNKTPAPDIIVVPPTPTYSYTPRGLRQRGPQDYAMCFRLDSFRGNLVLSVQEVSLPLQVGLAEPSARDRVRWRMERAWGWEGMRGWDEGVRRGERQLPGGQAVACYRARARSCVRSFQSVSPSNGSYCWSARV